MQTDLKESRSNGWHQDYNAQVDVGCVATGVECEVVLRGMADRLVALIRERGQAGRFICCAVAWFSNTTILAELVAAKRRGAHVLIVVQKEDFLRPDSAAPDRRAFGAALRAHYDALGTYDMEDAASTMAAIIAAARPFLGADVRGPIQFFDDEDSAPESRAAACRCVGNHNRDQQPSFPRMHNKFLVFGSFATELVPANPQPAMARLERVGGGGAPGELVLCGSVECARPELVWTGSYNLSAAAERSFENAVVLRSETIAAAYLAEFALLYLLSEPLDWESAWMRPVFYHDT